MSRRVSPSCKRYSVPSILYEKIEMFAAVFLVSALITASTLPVLAGRYYSWPHNSRYLDLNVKHFTSRQPRSVTFVDNSYEPSPKLNPVLQQQYEKKALAQSATEPTATHFVLRPLPPLTPKWETQAVLVSFVGGLLRTLNDNPDLLNQMRPYFSIAVSVLRYAPWILMAQFILLPALGLAAAMAVATPPGRRRRSADWPGQETLEFPFQLDGKNWMEQLKQVVEQHESQARSALKEGKETEEYPTKFNCCLQPNYRNLIKQTGNKGVVHCVPEGKELDCFNKLVYLIDVGGQIIKPVKLKDPLFWY